MSIAAGIYNAVGVEGSAQFGYANSGTEQVAIDLLLEGGEQVTTVLSFSEKSEPYSLDRLRALGWTGAPDPSFPGISTKQVQVKVFYESFEGKESMKVEILTGGRFSFKNAMPDANKRGFMARLSQGYRAAGGGPSPQARPTQARPTQGAAPAPQRPAYPQNGQRPQGGQQRPQQGRPPVDPVYPDDIPFGGEDDDRFPDAF